VTRKEICYHCATHRFAYLSEENEKRYLGRVDGIKCPFCGVPVTEVRNRPVTSIADRLYCIYQLELMVAEE
jgi:hypothetical protein